MPQLCGSYHVFRKALGTAMIITPRKKSPLFYRFPDLPQIPCQPILQI